MTDSLDRPQALFWLLPLQAVEFGLLFPELSFVLCPLPLIIRRSSLKIPDLSFRFYNSSLIVNARSFHFLDSSLIVHAELKKNCKNEV
jgi:hypothetical protein